jgi:hypothetical protein
MGKLHLFTSTAGELPQARLRCRPRGCDALDRRMPMLRDVFLLCRRDDAEFQVSLGEFHYQPLQFTHADKQRR